MPQHPETRDQTIGRMLSQWYSDIKIDEIIRAAGGLPATTLPCDEFGRTVQSAKKRRVHRRVALIRRLTVALVEWETNRQLMDNPSLSKERDQFRRIATASKKLLKAIGIPVNGNIELAPRRTLGALRLQANTYAERIGGFADCPPLSFAIDGTPATDWGGHAKVRACIDSVALLHMWADAEKHRLAAHVAPNRRDRHKGDQALNTLFAELAGIWRDIFEKAPGTSVTKEGRASGPFVRFVAACIKPLDIDLTLEAIRARIVRQLPGRISRSMAKES